jgi:hypothetical protein
MMKATELTTPLSALTRNKTRKKKVNPTNSQISKPPFTECKIKSTYFYNRTQALKLISTTKKKVQNKHFILFQMRSILNLEFKTQANRPQNIGSPLAKKF